MARGVRLGVLHVTLGEKEVEVEKRLRSEGKKTSKSVEYGDPLSNEIALSSRSDNSANANIK